MTRRFSRLASKTHNRKLKLETLERRDVPSFGAPQAYLAGSNPADIVSADFNGDGLHDVAVANQATPGFVNVLLNSGAGGFQAPKSFPTGGSGASSLAIADVSGDGKLDLVVTNLNSGTLAVLRGSGTGSFRRPITFAAGNKPVAVVLADFNNDTILDAGIANDIEGKISILIGQGAGAFQLAATYQVGTKARRLTAGDVNADGNADLVVVGSFDNAHHIVVFLGQGNGAFGPGPTYNGDSPGDVTAADFDADGDLDLAVASQNGDTLAIWRGNGNGTFQLLMSYTLAAGAGQKTVDAADLDGDGAQDLVVAVFEGALLVLLGQGNGQFDPAMIYPGGFKGTATVARDFTGDGIIDIAIANGSAGHGTVTLQVGPDGGAFIGPLPTYDAGINPTGMMATDLNGDGDPDIAVSTNAEPPGTTLSVLLGAGGASFQPKTSYQAGLSPTAVTSADFNSDGAADLSLATAGGPGSVSVALGIGDGTIQAAATYPVGINSIAVADFNNDGVDDIAGTAETGVKVLLGNGNGTFQTALNYSAGAGPLMVAAGDFDGDGLPDLAVTDDVNPGDGEVNILLNLGGGVFATPVPYAVGDRPWQVVVADFNGDGALDLAAANLDETFVSVLLGNGDGTFQAAIASTTDSGPRYLAAGDFDGNGVTDLVTANYGSPGETASVLLGNGDGSFQAPVNYFGIANPHGAEVADFNNDGNHDFVIVNYTHDSSVSVYLGNGDGTFQPGVVYPTGASSLGVAVADIDDDGVLDLAVSNSDISQQDNTSLSLLRGIGDGTFEPTIYYLAGPGPYYVAAADFNNDGDTDLGITNLGGSVSILLGNAANFAAIRNYNAGPSSQGVAAADFNGDGAPDLAVANAINPGTVSVLLGNGDGTFSSTAVAFTVDANPLDVAAGDFNGDGKQDLATANTGGDTVSILIGNGDGTFQSATSYPAGIDPIALALADMDNDGDLDIAAVNNLGTATVSILKGRGDGTFLPPQSYSVGSFAASIAAGDVNGDGIMDLAVGAVPGGVVSILLGNGDTTFQTAIHYATGNSPVGLALADVDADGWLDVVLAQFNGVTILINQANWPAPLPIGDGPRPVPPLDVLPTTEQPRPPTTPRLARIDLAIEPANEEGMNVAPGPQHVKRAIARLAVAVATEAELDLVSIEVV